MCKAKIAVVMAMAMGLAAAAYGGQAKIKITKTAKAPVIDGKLTDACWAKQAPLTDFTRNDVESTPAKKQTNGYICYDDKNLYIAARCEEPNVAGLSQGYTKRDDPIWENDCIEIFIVPRTGRYYQFIVNPVGTLYDVQSDYPTTKDGVLGSFGEFKRDDSWNCRGIKTAAYKGKDFWSLEIAIPISQIARPPKSGTAWLVNIAREEKQTNELSTFSPFFGDFHQIEAFSRLTFGADGAVLVRSSKEFVGGDLTPGAKEAVKADKGVEPVVFVTDYMERGYPTTLPKGGEITDTVAVFASLGEYEPATLSVRATGRGLEGVKVAVAGDLKAAGGAAIPSKNVDVRVVEIWKRWLTGRKYLYVERYLDKKPSVDIPAHTTQRFWLTVKVPQDAKGGVYRTKVLITAGAKTLKTLNLEVEVLPLRLEHGQGMGYFMYLPHWGFPRELITAEYLKKVFVDMREHGMTTATLYMYPRVVGGKVDLNKHHPWHFPFAGTMDVLRDTKLIRPGMPAIWLGADTGESSLDVWKQVLDEARKRNWPELVFYLQDEPGDEKRIKNAKRLFRRLDEFKKKHPEYAKVRSTTAIGLTGIKALGELYDIWITGAGGVSEPLSQEAKNMGKLMWSYDCGLGQVDAETCRYYFGLWGWRMGLKGCSLWAYSDIGNPGGIKDWKYITEHRSDIELDFSFIYPMPEGPVPSIGWEAVREGIDDRKYIVTLTNLIEKARAAGHTKAAAEASGTLKEIFAKIRPEGYLAAIRAGTATKRRLGGHFDRPSPQDNITKGDYSKFRYKIAGEIMRLRKEMKQ